VSEIDVAAQLRLLEVRRELERLMVRGAARRASKPQRKRFQQIASGMDQVARRADDLAFMRLDREFNLLLLEAAGNEFGAATLGLLPALAPIFDRTGLQEDWNVAFPIDRLRELAAEGTIGSMADTHYSFMGATDPLQMEPHTRELALSG
jgi:hypothetical protein